MQQATRASIVLAIVACATSAHATSYTATLLHPAGFVKSRAIGASDTKQVGFGYPTSTPSNEHALLWTGTPASVIDLHPAALGFTASEAMAIDGSSQIGFGSTSSTSHAMLWSGTAASAVDLNSAGFSYSYGVDVSGTKQIGYAFGTATGSKQHAVLWSGTAASVVDLHPAGFNESTAAAIVGNKQVGEASTTVAGVTHAMLWSGTAASAVDLHPTTGFTYTWALGMSSTTQAGYGSGTATGNKDHALLWQGTAASEVDLNPTGFTASYARGASSTMQVGWGTTAAAVDHALYWTGTAASAVDLHSLLTGLGPTFVSSQAWHVSPNGSIAGYARDSGGIQYAVLWTPTSSESGVAGDYNNNGTVDAGDYATWRKGSTTLHNEVTTIGSNTAGDYTEWRKRFGNPSGSGVTLDGAAIPEPSTISLSLLLGITLLARKRVPLLTR